jgi:hypothetical protein
MHSASDARSPLDLEYVLEFIPEDRERKET